LGKVPILENIVEHMLSVDHMSSAIISLSLQQHSGRNFNLISPRLTNWNNFFTKLHSLGYVLEQIPYTQWRNELSIQTENALYPILSTFPTEENFTEPKLRDNYQQEDFIGADWPVINDELLDIYFAYFWKSGFLDTPS
jgi:hypothetical protein